MSQVYAVTDLLSLVDDLLAAHAPAEVEVMGTVSSWRVRRGWGSGELCTVLEGTVAARLPFSIPVLVLSSEITNDMVVLITGTLETNPPWHPLRLQGRALRMVARSSHAAIRREELVATMRADGRLTAQQRLAFPDVVTTVGLVTAAGSAARADIMGTLAGTRTPVRLIEEHAVLSGAKAPASVAAAIARVAASRPDVVVIARGGGASAELATFDAEEVADAISTCPVPVIAAIGHATDRSVADQVAHTSVVTPTAAAVLIASGHQRRRQQAADQAASRLLEAANQEAQAATAAALRESTRRRMAVGALIGLLVVAAVLALVLLATR